MSFALDTIYRVVGEDGDAQTPTIIVRMDADALGLVEILVHDGGPGFTMPPEQAFKVAEALTRCANEMIHQKP